MPAEPGHALPPGARVAPGAFRYFENAPTPAELTVLDFPAPVRWRRAALAWAGCWAAAIAAVFLPVLHFVLVPTLLVAGPLVARRRLSERQSILEARGTCPACGGPIAESLRAAPAPTHRLRCDHCGRAIELVPDASLLVP